MGRTVTMARKVAFITGITGQDGSYLAEFLLEKGYEVHGIKRRASSFNQSRIEHIFKDAKGRDPEKGPLPFFTHYGEVTDLNNLVTLLNKVKPIEFYNLAAQSHVHTSFELPVYTGHVDGIGTLNCLEAIRQAGLAGTCKFYQASTSELYGKIQEPRQSETTPFYPRSPYACAKLMAYWCVVNYREAYNMFAVNGILFNHESPRRGETFVTRKITRAVAAIKCMELVWEGSGLDMVGKEKANGKVRVCVDSRYFRPTEVDVLLGNPDKAKTKLGWNPTQTPFKQLVTEMVDADIKLYSGGVPLLASP